MKNRELKFRIWDMQYKRFVKGYENKNDYEELYSDPPGLIFGALAHLNEYGEYYTIQQFTGLKDKNGKEIYEGDIVGYSAVSVFDKDDSGHIEKSTIIYQEGYFGLSNLKYDDCQIMPLGFNTNILGSLSLNHKVEIIGNIFENKDLLL